MTTLLIRRFILLFIILAAGWFGFKVYTETKIIDTINKYAFLASPFVIVTYDDVTVHVTGKLSLSDLKLTPTNISETPFHVEKLSVIFPGTIDMLKFMYDVAMEEITELPNSLRFQFDGINISITGNEDVFASFIRGHQLLLKEELEGVSEPICGDEYAIGPQDLKKMGIHTLMDGHFWEYKYIPESQKMIIHFGFSATNLYTLSMKANFNKKGPPGLQDMMQMPPISSAEILYQDKGLTKMTNQHCARLSGISTAEYINRIANLPDDYYFLSAGIVPNEAMKKAYIDFLKNPQSIAIKAQLPPNFNPMAAAIYDTEHWVPTFGLSLEVNSNNVSPFEIITPDPSGYMDDQSEDFDMTVDIWGVLETIDSTSTDEPEIQMDWEPEASFEQDTTTTVFFGEQPINEQETANEKEAASLHRPSPGYGDIPVYKLPDHIGRQVEVFVERSKSFTGELLAVDREALMLRVRVGGGTITMPIRIQRIKSIEAR